MEQFGSRFQQFTIIEHVATFLVNPFTTQVVMTETAESIAELHQAETSEIEEEIIDFQNDLILKTRDSDEIFWNLVDKDKSKKNIYVIFFYFYFY